MPKVISYIITKVSLRPQIAIVGMFIDHANTDLNNKALETWQIQHLFQNSSSEVVYLLR